MITLSKFSFIMRVCVTGGGGFIGSHLCKKLKELGHYVVAADWKHNEYFEQHEFCDEFHHVDLRILQNCVTVTKECEQVFHLAADMGGMGFIQSNHGTILFNNTVMSCHVLEASRMNQVRRVFYSSSACVYPIFKQTDSDVGIGLKESDAWPAQPEDAYGLEKLCTEELCMHYAKDFGMEVRIARFHNVYGPYGTWNGGREKAPAAMCRKVAATRDYVEVWGDGEQTRSFMYIDDCVEGILKIMDSNITVPLNLGSSELVTINNLVRMIIGIANKPTLSLKHLPGPLGVRGRNSDNTLIRELLNWEPCISLEEGLRKTYEWIEQQVVQKVLNGCDASEYTQSQVYSMRPPSDLHASG